METQKQKRQKILQADRHLIAENTVLGEDGGSILTSTLIPPEFELTTENQYSIMLSQKHSGPFFTRPLMVKKKTLNKLRKLLSAL